EVAFTEAAGAVALDDLEEDRRPVAERGSEDLEQVALVVAVGENPEPAELGERLIELPQALRHLVAVALGGAQEPDPACPQSVHRTYDVAGRQRDVLGAGAVV